MQHFSLTYCSGQTQGVITIWMVIIGTLKVEHFNLRGSRYMRWCDTDYVWLQTYITYLFWFMQNHSCLRVRQQNLKRIYYKKKKSTFNIAQLAEKKGIENLECCCKNWIPVFLSACNRNSTRISLKKYIINK